MHQAGAHTIEYLGATFLKNDPDWGKNILYFGPMGCRTGFYVIIKTIFGAEEIRKLIEEMCEYILNFNGDIPSVTPKECGNFSSHNLELAKCYVNNYLSELRKEFHCEYPKSE